MRLFVPSLVACSLLLHAVMGCCWHYDHEHATADRDVCCGHEAVADCCGHHAGDHDGDTHHGQPTHDPSESHSHCHGLCTYLPVQKAQVDTQQLDMPIDFAAILPATYDAQVAGVLSFARVHENAAEPPVRLHLFHQVLLI